jgi:hypothetical protein
MVANVPATDAWNALRQAEIIQDPAKYVEKDPTMARTLLDQREAVRTA